ncbi:T9SS C-terminal target domain-containing protein [Sphingobacteriales bacterium UPWRP_1]|nr:hypothetical protein B6N25_08460 [Sphingobacteriales bacterium TSM_CSS]PSJ73016.1 T9SS C-terminal target domain-containing protein [Sphingobacteriales bacterium UPWRP_1]
MKKKLFITYNFFIYTAVFAQVQTGSFTYFNKTFGGNDTINILAQAVQPLEDGYLVLGGYSSANINNARYLVRLDENGDALWIKNIVTGSQWNVIEDGKFVCATTDSNIVVAIGGIVNNAAKEIHLFKIDHSGNEIWHRVYESDTIKLVRHIVQTSDNGFAMAGLLGTSDTAKFLLIKTDAEGWIEWQRTYKMGNDARAFSVQQTPWDGGYIIGGWGYSTTTGYDMFVVKTLANGDTLWTKRYGGIYDDCAALVVPVTTLDEHLAGYPVEYVLTACWKQGATMFDRRFYIAKIDETGNVIWDYKYNNYQAMPGLQTFPIVKSNKEIVGATGFTNAIGQKEAVIFNFRATGTIKWSKPYTINSEKDCYLKDLQPTPDGGYVLAGYQYSSPQTAWVLKIDSLGNTCSYVGCDSTVVVEVVPSIPIHSNPKILAMVYPVPATTHLNISYQIPAAVLPFGGAVWQLFDAFGRQLAEKTLQGSAGVEQVSVAHLPSGLYYYRVTTPQGQRLASGKVVVEQ